jgi:hypothetical protein
MPSEVAQLVRIDGAEHRSDRLPVVGDRRSGEVAAPLGTEDAVAITGQAEQRIAGLGEEDDLADPAGLRQIDLAAIDAAAHHDPRSTSVATIRWRISGPPARAATGDGVRSSEADAETLRA